MTLVAVLTLSLSSVLFADNAEQVTDVQVVNINTADAETLAQNLVGVGLNRAEAIVIYREKYGRFFAPEELTAVRGIGDTTIKKNQNRIVVD